MLHVTCCVLHVACCMLHVTYCMLHVTCCMLHVACCMLHVACGLLHVACGMLRRGFRLEAELAEVRHSIETLRTKHEREQRDFLHFCGVHGKQVWSLGSDCNL